MVHMSVENMVLSSMANSWASNDASRYSFDDDPLIFFSVAVEALTCLVVVPNHQSPHFIVCHVELFYVV